MNIQYHYHVIKTLARKAGIPEDRAERIAHYSQFIDDYNIVRSIKANSPQNANQELVDFFTQHGYLKDSGKGKCLFKPATTGVHAFKSITDSAYQRQTLATYHFIPTRPLYELNPSNPDRTQYRCQTVQVHHLISDMMQAVFQRLLDTPDNSQLEADTLMEFGMVLHTYCDTYAHKYFSGLHGWENDAKLIDSVNNLTNAREMSFIDQIAALAPAVGHACIGHAPDSCNHTISFYVQKDCKDKKRSLHINDLDNTQAFMKCSKEVYEKLCEYSGMRGWNHVSWEAIQADLQATMQQGQSKKEAELNSFWANSAVGRGISYVYNKNHYFRLELQVDEVKEDLLLENGFSMDDLMDFYSERGEEARQLTGAKFTLLNEEFLLYNKLSYERMNAMNNTYPPALTIAELEEVNETDRMEEA